MLQAELHMHSYSVYWFKLSILRMYFVWHVYPFFGFALAPPANPAAIGGAWSLLGVMANTVTGDYQLAFLWLLLVEIVLGVISHSWSLCVQLSLLLFAFFAAVAWIIVATSSESQIPVSDAPFELPQLPRLNRSVCWACCRYNEMQEEVSTFHRVSLTQDAEDEEIDIEIDVVSVSVLPGIKVIQDAACACCLEDFIPASQVAILACGHVFHKVCISRWSRMATSCPICRIQFFLEADPGV